jgi:hypothetical protein
MTGGGQHLELDGAFHKVIDGLLGHQAEEVPGLGGLLGGGEVPAGEVAAADVEDLAVADEPFGGLPDLLSGCAPVDVVELVELNVVGAKPAQAVFAGSADVQRR